MPRGDGRVPEGLRRSEISRVPAAARDGGGRQAGAEDGARRVRLQQVSRASVLVLTAAFGRPCALKGAASHRVPAAPQ
ncbi:hypothetical protein BLAT2472_20789 [Burkholderia latens]